ncbi:MAG TPA: 5'/3'-nucleotidase SurE [Candidatus Cloacimonetes bacterium]|nr:5'/3'-nucleotidase SurE [Candidatus Cloacimonadota bacterium]HEX37970.1 5'/3'-nucleotidase SurE [Candidatus Cloacimonadota bacterium]
MKNILLTNDDGVFAEGISELAKVLRRKYQVTIVAPDRERSAASHSLTIHHPLRIFKIKEDKYAVDGTPTDCVILATHKIIQSKIDLVISGINNGPNMGEDILYSGTVAAAIEAMNLGLPAIAVSMGSRDKGEFSEGAEILLRMLDNNLFSILTTDCILNINLPPVPLKEINSVKVTKLGHRVYSDFIKERKDPRGRPYFWIGGQTPKWTGGVETDFHAVENNSVSITPITIDMTKYAYFPTIKKWVENKLNTQPLL